MLSITSDFATDKGCPEKYLRLIGETGFSHIHWCHQWNTDFVYMPAEIEQIERWLGDYGLRLLDLHASDGQEKRWVSDREYERLAGVELVKNRLEMCGVLGGDAVVMHTGREPKEEKARERFWTQLRRSLDELESTSRRTGVRIAIENGEFHVIERLLEEYPEDYVGMCYDCGHGNCDYDDGLDRAERLKDRIIAVHLHDNNGERDEHKIPFTGTVDWERLARILATSKSYLKPVSMEVSIRNMPEYGQWEYTTEQLQAFLADAFAAGERLSGLMHSFQ